MSYYEEEIDSTVASWCRFASILGIRAHSYAESANLSVKLRVIRFLSGIDSILLWGEWEDRGRGKLSRRRSYEEAEMKLFKFNSVNRYAYG